jgi:MoaA/NifB/PqqE/SkfB family radical SAM enzyme
LHLLDGKTPSEFVNNEEFKKHRLQLWNGEWPSGCHQCQEEEFFGNKSMRMDYDESFFNPETGEIGFESIQHIELRFNNSCNMACLHCDTVFSSGWETALKKYEPDDEVQYFNLQQLTKQRHTAKVDSETQTPSSTVLPRIDMRVGEVDRVADDLINNFPNLGEFNVSGGEPLKQKQFLHLLDRMKEHPNASKIQAMFYTNFNADFDPVDLAEKLLPFEDSCIHISVDSGKNLYPYFRDGSWDVLKENIRLFKESKSNRLSTNLVSGICTTSIYQLMDLYNVFKDMLTLDIDLIECSLVYTPEYINPGILMEHFPDEVRQDIKETREMIENSDSKLKETALIGLSHIEQYMNNHIIELYNETKLDGLEDNTKRFIKYVEESDKLFGKDFNSTFTKYQINNNKLIRTHKETL